MNYKLFEAINQLAGHHPVLDGLMIFVTKYSLVIYALVLILMWLFGKEKSKYTVVYAAISGALGLFINFVIGHIYYEPRPFITHKGVHLLISHAADASFPSDHTTGAFSIALVVFLRRHKIGLGLLVFALVTGFSRIYVGHHYPLDVIGGIVVGLVISSIIYRISPMLQPFATGIINIYNKVPLVPKNEQSDERTRNF